MSYMFCQCSNLEEININIDNTDSRKYLNLKEMFSGCEKLKFIDLSKLNLDRVLKYEHIFSGCSQSLKQIIKSQNKGFKDIAFD